MPWQRLMTWAALLAALVALGGWQWHEYGHECALARESVVRFAESVMNALVGGVQSHRRMGFFFIDQAQGMLDELVRSQDVLVAALVSEDGSASLSAGRVEQLDLSAPCPPGGTWQTAGFRLMRRFRLPAEVGGPGAGFGGGRGWERRRQMLAEEPPSAFAPGAAVAAVLLVDRTRADEACRRAALSRVSVVAAGWLLVVCVAIAWRATVRLAEARGRTHMLEAEARHLRDLSQAAAGLAHETRNPLGLIRGWAQRLADSVANDAEGNTARALVEECDRVTARINQFLAFARPSDPRPERFDPASLVAELAALLEPDLAARRVTLSKMAPGNTVLADREMLREALFNLLQNAVQASGEGGVVETALRRGRDGRLCLEVADRGPGVAEEHVPRLFTPYFTTRPDGAGLGLAIVRRIAAAHGWEVGYRPRPGGGAVFWLDGIHG